MSRLQGVVEVWTFLKENRRWWLVPIVVVLMMAALLLAFAGTSALAPFIYTMF